MGDPVRGIEFSGARKNLMVARLKAQAAIMKGAARTKKGAFGSNKYATLESVLEVVAEPLCDAGLVLTQWVGPVEFSGPKGERKHVNVYTRIEHAETSEYMQTWVQIPLLKDDAPGIGSGTTYGRRYGLKAFVGMPEIDDDGAAASGQNSELRPARISARSAKANGGGEKYNEIAAAMREATSLDMLRHVAKAYQDDVDDLPDQWRTMLNEEYETKREELAAKEGA